MLRIYGTARATAVDRSLNSQEVALLARWFLQHKACARRARAAAGSSISSFACMHRLCTTAAACGQRCKVAVTRIHTESLRTPSATCPAQLMFASPHTSILVPAFLQRTAHLYMSFRMQAFVVHVSVKQCRCLVCSYVLCCRSMRALGACLCASYLCLVLQYSSGL